MEAKVRQLKGEKKFDPANAFKHNKEKDENKPTNDGLQPLRTQNK